MCFLIIFQAVRMMSKTCNQLNNIVGHDHRAVKRVTRPMLGFTSFQAARRTLVGIELMHMMKKKPDSPGFSGKISTCCYYWRYLITLSCPQHMRVAVHH